MEHLHNAVEQFKNESATKKIAVLTRSSTESASDEGKINELFSSILKNIEERFADKIQNGGIGIRACLVSKQKVYI